MVWELVTFSVSKYKVIKGVQLTYTIIYLVYLLSSNDGRLLSSIFYVSHAKICVSTIHYNILPEETTNTRSLGMIQSPLVKSAVG